MLRGLGVQNLENVQHRSAAHECDPDAAVVAEAGCLQPPLPGLAVVAEDRPVLFITRGGDGIPGEGRLVVGQWDRAVE